MQIAKFEQILIQLSFITLFGNTLLHWITMASVLPRSGIHTPKHFKLAPKIGMLLANGCLTALLLERWYFSGHLPFSNLYESFVFLGWSLTFAHLLLQDKIASPAWYTPPKHEAKQLSAYSAETNTWLGAITAPSAMLTQSFASFSLPIDMQKSTALVPALQSNWLMMHVSMMILSYGALLFGSLLALTLLVVSRNKRLKEQSDGSEREFLSYKEVGLQGAETFLRNNDCSSAAASTYDDSFIGDLKILQSKTIHISGSQGSTSCSAKQSLEWLFFETRKIYLLDQLDNWSYRAIGIGFPLLTVGILSGAVWANEAWGSYWSWDPKETWALVTWLIFAVYLHTRMTKGWTGDRPAFVASLGLFVVWACYLGVNLLGKGLHSYGWLN